MRITWTNTFSNMLGLRIIWLNQNSKCCFFLLIKAPGFIFFAIFEYSMRWAVIIRNEYIEKLIDKQGKLYIQGIWSFYFDKIYSFNFS